MRSGARTCSVSRRSGLHIMSEGKERRPRAERDEAHESHGAFGQAIPRAPRRNVPGIDAPLFGNASRAVIIFAATVISIGGLKGASSWIVPIILAFFFAALIWPPVTWLHNKGVPRWAGLTLASLVLLGAVVGFGATIATSIDSFTSEGNEYRAQFRDKIIEGTRWLNEQLEPFGVDVSTEAITGLIRPELIFGTLTDFMSGLTGALSNSFFVLLTLAFTLAEVNQLPRKMIVAFADSEEELARMGNVLKDINRFMGITTLTSFLGAIVAGLLCVILDVPYAMLWALLAFILNFVPNIGSILAAIPPVLLALLLGGFGDALLMAFGHLMINLVLDSIIKPRIMGESLGLSTLIVFISLVFWGWVFGPIGMILSIPLTMVARIMFENSNDMRWVSVLMQGRIADEQLNAHQRAKLEEWGVSEGGKPPLRKRITAKIEAIRHKGDEAASGDEGNKDA